MKDINDLCFFFVLIYCDCFYMENRGMFSREKKHSDE